MRIRNIISLCGTERQSEIADSRKGRGVKVEKGVHNGVRVLSFSGEVDLHTAPVMKETIYKTLEEGVKDIILDLGGISFMDSSGLGVLVGTLKRVRSAGGSVCLICFRDSVLKVLRLTGLDQVFTIYSSLEEYEPPSRS